MARAILWDVQQESYTMKTKVVLTSAALTLASALSAYAGCANHSEQAMSCAEGTVWDSEARVCVPQTTS